MNHTIHRVEQIEQAGTYVLSILFADGLTRTIDFEPVLEGEIYAPLRDPELFAQARVDPEVRTVVWPCGADFDPAILHDWPEHEAAFRRAAERWKRARLAA